jgi:tyrosine-protein phosphatase SIW14
MIYNRTRKHRAPRPQNDTVPQVKEVKGLFAHDSKLKALGFLLFIGIIAAAYLVDQHRTLYHFRTVDPGKLYRSGTLSRRGWDKVYAMTGIKTIINLRSEAEMNAGPWYATEKEFAAAKGVSLFDLSMPYDTPPTPAQVKRFLAIVTDPARLPALVHCEMGVIRTGMMVAVYRIAVLQETNRKVLEEMPMFGHTLDNRPEVRDFILDFTPEPSRGWLYFLRIESFALVGAASCRDGEPVAAGCRSYRKNKESSNRKISTLYL